MSKKSMVWYYYLYNNSRRKPIFIDLYTLKIVYYSLKSHMRTSLVIDTLNMAITNEKP